ncbi:MAG: asparagine synthase (glutamine-hydrolyzing) [Candidatus Hodarchaeales archaeon]
MCGISGIVRISQDSFHDLNEEILTHMNDQMELRGPDDAGIYISPDNRVGLTNRRLKILDLSIKGHQPMSNKDQTIWVAFNGEIFNFQIIRKELESLGYEFFSSSDTEVIVYAFEEWGIECLHKFNGQFAIAIYDVRDGKKDFFLIRDRFGIKPLHYCWLDDKKTLVFASIIPSILAHPRVPREINISAISDYLSFRYALGNQTFFKRIFRLQPGHYLYIDLLSSTQEVKRYYKLIDNIKFTSDISFNKMTETVLNKLEESTRLRLISDVPFGAYLSGGVDSSAVVALMNKIHDEKIRTYTIGFESKNEFEFASQVAERYQTIHKEINQSPEKYFNLMTWLIKQRGEPLGVPNEIPLYEMSKGLKSDITVVLSGEGADEIFMGYGRIFRLPQDWRKLSMPVPTFIKKLLFPSIFKKYGHLELRDFIDLFIYRYSYVPLELKNEIFTKKALEKIKSSRNGINENIFYRDFFSAYFREVEDQNLETQISYVFEMVHLPNLLQRVDNSTLSTSVEGRVPFVDHNVVETVIGLPIKYKLKWKSLVSRLTSFRKTSDEISEKYDIPKFLLKEAFKSYLPFDVLYRKKMGFPVPLGEFFKSGFSDIVHDYLLSPESFTKEIFSQSKIKELVDNFTGTWESGFLLWQLLNVEIWFREVVNKTSKRIEI